MNIFWNLVMTVFALMVLYAMIMAFIAEDEEDEEFVDIRQEIHEIQRR